MFFDISSYEPFIKNKTLSGLFYTEGDLWKNQKRFFVTHLKEQGFGKRFQELEIEINEEILNLIDLIKNGPKYSFERVDFRILQVNFIYIYK